MNIKQGMLIAMTAGGLFASACKKNESNGSSSGSSPGSTAAPAEKTAKVHCSGVNECKGKGGCKTEKNACAGQNGCKGQGFTDMTESECKDKGGTILASTH